MSERRHRKFCPQVECLESRCSPASFIVANRPFQVTLAQVVGQGFTIPSPAIVHQQVVNTYKAISHLNQKIISNLRMRLLNIIRLQATAQLHGVFPILAPQTTAATLSAWHLFSGARP